MLASAGVLLGGAESLGKEWKEAARLRFGSFKAETVQDIKAEKGMEEEKSEMSGVLSMSLCRREVPAIGWGAGRRAMS
jgi:hypothetical protein